MGRSYNLGKTSRPKLVIKRYQQPKKMLQKLITATIFQSIALADIPPLIIKGEKCPTNIINSQNLTLESLPNYAGYWYKMLILSTHLPIQKIIVPLLITLLTTVRISLMLHQLLLITVILTL